MAIPLFGFNAPQPRVQGPTAQPKPDFGDFFNAAFQPAVEQSSRQFHQQRQNELDRAFEEAHQRRAIRAERSMLEDKQRENRFLAEAAGEFIPATKSNLETLRPYVSDNEMQRAVRTSSEGQQYIAKPYWDRVMEAGVLDIETQTPVPEEDADFLSPILGEDFAISPETIAEVTDADGNGRVSPNAVARLRTEQNLRLEAANLMTERMRLMANSRTEIPEYSDYWEARHKFMSMNLQDGEGNPVTGQEKVAIADMNAQLRTGLHPPNSPYSGRVAANPNAVSNMLLEHGYKFTTPPTAELAKENIQEVLDSASTEEGAANFVARTVGRTAITREDIDREAARKLFNTDDWRPNNKQIAEMTRQSPSLRKALYLLGEFDDTEQLTNYFRDYGGYNEFRDIFDSTTMNHVRALAPDSFGDFSIQAANTLTSAPPGTGNTSPRADNPSRRDTIPPTPAEVVSGDQDTLPEHQRIVQNGIDNLSATWQRHMELDPAFDNELTEFLQEASDPESGPEMIISELEDVARLSMQNGDFTEAQRNAALVQLQALQFEIDSDRENFVRNILPLLQDAAEKARLNLRNSN